MSYNDQDYQRLAKAIVDDFVAHDAALQASVVKTAGDMSMNAHETRRLIEATNLNAHLVLFEKMADHKYVDFQVVEPEAVCDLLFSSPEPVSEDSFGKMASLNLELPDERWSKFGHAAAEKLAAEAFPQPEPPAPVEKYAGVKGHHAVQLTKKLAEELEMKVRTTQRVFEEKVATLSDAFSFMYAMPFNEFELDAMSHTNKMASAVILRKMREYNPKLPPTTKTAHAGQRYYIETREHVMFKEAVDAHTDAVEAAHGYQWYIERAKGLLT